MKEQVTFPVPYHTCVPVQPTPQTFTVPETLHKPIDWRNPHANHPNFIQLFDEEQLSQKKHRLLSQSQRPSAIDASPLSLMYDCRNQSGSTTCPVQPFNNEHILRSGAKHHGPKAIEMTIDPDFDRFRNQSEANGGLATKYTDCSSRNVRNPPIPQIDQGQARNRIEINQDCPKVQKLVLQTSQKMKMAELKAIQSAEVLQLKSSSTIELIKFDFDERLKKLCSNN